MGATPRKDVNVRVLCDTRLQLVLKNPYGQIMDMYFEQKTGLGIEIFYAPRRQRFPWTVVDRDWFDVAPPETVCHTIYVVCVDTSNALFNYVDDKMVRERARFTTYPLYVAIHNTSLASDHIILRDEKSLLLTHFLLKRLARRHRLPSDVLWLVARTYQRAFHPSVLALIVNYRPCVELVEYATATRVMIPLCRVLAELRRKALFKKADDETRTP